MSDERPSRYMDETVIHMAELMTPNYENFSGKVHGGAILGLLDKVAYVCACRYAGAYCVTVSVDRVEFREPVLVGELLHFTARVVQVGRSSMEIEVMVESQELREGSSRHTNTCYFRMVAMQDGRPAPVPALRVRTPEDEQRLRRGELLREVQDEFRRRLREIAG